MSTREIRTSQVDTSCDVCGRTLLRGERAEAYLDGGERRSVCELCKSRAIHEGWIREGTVPAYGGPGTGSERRRGLLGRLRLRGGDGVAAPSARPTLGDELDGQAWQDAGAAGEDVMPDRRSTPEPPSDRDRTRDRNRDRTRDRDRSEPSRTLPSGRRSPTREPRHVRAVPTSAGHKQAEAVDLFNASEHRRTIAGVARSLGIPTVAVIPSALRASAVDIVVSWELCWYRYEVDLSDDEPSVRVAAQGYELSELEPSERQPDATSDDSGLLTLAP